MRPQRRPGIVPGTFVRKGLGTTAITLPTVTSVTPASDRYPLGGASVTITGTNFSNNLDGTAPTVLFGSAAATSVVVVNSTTITCNTPAQTAPGVYSITVTVNGKSATLANCFNYVTSYITGISPNFAAAPGGTKAVIFGLNFVVGSTVKFDGVTAVSAVVDSQTIFVTVPGPHPTGTVDVTVTEPGGTVTTLRGGFQYTLLNRGSDIRRSQPSAVQCSFNLGQPGTCTFSIDGQSNKPSVGEKIVIEDSKDGNRVIFAGNITSVEQDYEDQTDQLVWQCTATDFTFQLNKYRVFGKFTTVSASEVVKTIVSQFAPGFTTAHVQTNLAPVTVYFDGSQDFATCLTQIAQGIGGGHWYVDENRDVHFFHIAAPTLADLPGVIPGGVQLTTANGTGLLQDMSGVANPASVTPVLVN